MSKIVTYRCNLCGSETTGCAALGIYHGAYGKMTVVPAIDVHNHLCAVCVEGLRTIIHPLPPAPDSLQPES